MWPWPSMRSQAFICGCRGLVVLKLALVPDAFGAVRALWHTPPFAIDHGRAVSPYELFIGLRYTRARQRTRFISVISIISIVGIALGMTVLITVLSVMNGFQREIR